MFGEGVNRAGEDGICSDPLQRFLRPPPTAMCLDELQTCSDIVVLVISGLQSPSVSNLPSSGFQSGAHAALFSAANAGIGYAAFVKINLIVQETKQIIINEVVTDHLALHLHQKKSSCSSSLDNSYTMDRETESFVSHCEFVTQMSYPHFQNLYLTPSVSRMVKQSVLDAHQFLFLLPEEVFDAITGIEAELKRTDSCPREGNEH
uniref:Uncharacterized protein n=1 Tax=Chenopodium quinoa TaxID=63459 RepID=A0A803MT81_CHEQI